MHIYGPPVVSTNLFIDTSPLQAISILHIFSASFGCLLSPWENESEHQSFHL